MRYLLRLAAALLLLLLVAAPAFAQNDLYITDVGRRLDRAAVERAAQPLLNRGIAVAVYVVQSGGEDDLRERLIDDGLARADGAARSQMVALYVALDQRYSSIVYGDALSDALTVNDNYELIRQDQLNAGLSDNDFTGGVVAALTAIDAAVANPPDPGGGINIDPTPFVVGGLGLAAAGAGGVALSRRNRARKLRQAAEQRLKEAREGAGAVIADLGQRFRGAEDKAQYDKVSYTPADVARLAQLQQAARASFVKVQTDFDDVGEQLGRSERPTDAQLDQAASVYATVREAGAAASEQLAVVERTRVELDQLAQQGRQEVDRAKKS